MKKSYEIDLKRNIMKFDKERKEVSFGHLYDDIIFGNNKKQYINTMDIIARGISDKKATIKLVIEYEDEILDEIEKKYLENLLRPFKNRDIIISKNSTYNSKKEYLCIEIINCDTNIVLPDFKANTMYKGMEVGYEYDIEELKLFQKRVDK